MFVLDTNIISAIMGLQPVPEFAAWIAGQPDALLFTTAISQAEILSGLAIMPQGRRRTTLEAAAQAIFTEDFKGRILPFNESAAASYAAIIASRRLAGRPIAPLDLMIAAIAHSQTAAMVTRNSAGFEGCGVAVINPWSI